MKDEWLRAAMSDDMVVAELLLRLKQTQAHVTPSPPPPTAISKLTLPTFEWGVRLPRSRPVLRCGAPPLRKDREPTRGSPTTPLSWSGGSVSGGGAADGVEESSGLNNRISADRSKGIATNDPTTTANANKRRLKKKKTFPELKEEETLLLKERSYLKMEISRFRAIIEEKKVENESCKRMKRNVDAQLARKPNENSEPESATPSQPHQMEASRAVCNPLGLQTNINKEEEQPSLSCKVEAALATPKKGFILPDLNMMPSEEYPVAGTLYCMS